VVCPIQIASLARFADLTGHPNITRDVAGMNISEEKIKLSSDKRIKLSSGLSEVTSKREGAAFSDVALFSLLVTAINYR
jgi:hypothetical protein